MHFLPCGLRQACEDHKLKSNNDCLFSEVYCCLSFVESLHLPDTVCKKHV